MIGVDLHGHGRTDLGNRDINLVEMGSDIAGVVTKLGYKKVDVLGYSLGGGVAFQVAAQHPELVRRLVLVSTAYRTDGFYPEMLPQQAAVSSAMLEQMKGTPMYQSYVAIAPHPEDFPKLLDKMGAYMRKQHDWSADVKKLTMPTMLIYGDSDMIRLAIVPNVTHYEMGVAPQMVETALPFLNGYQRAGTWAEQVEGAK